MTKNKEVKTKKFNFKEISMKGLFPEDKETTEIIEEARREWAKKLVYLFDFQLKNILIYPEMTHQQI